MFLCKLARVLLSDRPPPAPPRPLLLSRAPAVSFFSRPLCPNEQQEHYEFPDIMFCTEFANGCLEETNSCLELSGAAMISAEVSRRRTLSR